MQIKNLPSKKLVVKKDATILDWQKQFSDTCITVGPQATLTYILAQGLGNTQDRNIEISLGARSSLTVSALMVGAGKDRLVTNLLIRHDGPQTRSNIVMKGIVADEAHGTLNGTVVIEKRAHGADAWLEERVLLLSDTARAKTLPHLEILADDVKASHAATLSKISDEELFYLQSRGLPEALARKIIIAAFLHTQLSTLPEDERTHTLMMALDKKLKTIA